MTHLLQIAQTLAWRRPRRHTVGVDVIAAMLVALALLGGWVVFYFYPQNSVQLKAEFTPELVDMIGMQDSTGQRLAHQVFLGLVGAGALAGIVLCRAGCPVLGGRTGAGLAWVAAWVRRPPLLLWLAIFICASAVSARPYLAIPGVASVVCLPLLVSRHPPWIARLAIVSVMVVYVGFAILPGFAGPIYMVHPLSKVPHVAWHYNAVVGGAADRIAAGARIFRDVVPSYGLLFASFLAAAERHFGVLDFGGHVRVVQAAQAAFVLIAVAAHGIWARGRLVQMLIALALIVPWTSTFSYFIWYPNLTAWRSLGFAIACLALVMLKRSPTPRGTAAIGALCALALLINLEMGIAITAGALVFVLSAIDRDVWRALPRVSAQLVVGGALVGLAFAVAYRLGIGHWPISRHLGSVFQAITASVQGYGGVRFTFAPLALWILIHSTYLVVRGGMIWRLRGLSHAWRVRVALAIMILVWFAYYANRPLPFKLHLHIFLYSFLLYDLLTPVSRLMRIRRPVWPITHLAALLVGIVLLPTAYSMQEEMRRDLRKFTAHSGATTELSGVEMDVAAAEELNTQASFLSSHSGGKLVHFTANPYLLSLMTGIYGPLKTIDPFNATITPRQFNGLVKQTLHLRPAMVLFDAPKNLLAGRPTTRRFYKRLRRAISAAYRRDHVESGWEVWIRRGHVRARRVAVAATVQSFH